MDWAELSRPALPAAPAQTPDVSRPHRESWEAWGEDGPPSGTAAGSPSGTSTSRPSWGAATASSAAAGSPSGTSAKLDLRLPLAFLLLCFASVSMTLGNKWLMTRPALRLHTELVIIMHRAASLSPSPAPSRNRNPSPYQIVILQNSLAVCVTGSLVLLGALRVKPVSRRQMVYFTWDAYATEWIEPGLADPRQSTHALVPCLGQRGAGGAGVDLLPRTGAPLRLRTNV